MPDQLTFGGISLTIILTLKQIAGNGLAYLGGKNYTDVLSSTGLIHDFIVEKGNFTSRERNDLSDLSDTGSILLIASGVVIVIAIVAIIILYKLRIIQRCWRSKCRRQKDTYHNNAAQDGQNLMNKQYFKSQPNDDPTTNECKS